MNELKFGFQSLTKVYHTRSQGWRFIIPLWMARRTGFDFSWGMTVSGTWFYVLSIVRPGWQRPAEKMPHAKDLTFVVDLFGLRIAAGWTPSDSAIREAFQ